MHLLLLVNWEDVGNNISESSNNGSGNVSDASEETAEETTVWASPWEGLKEFGTLVLDVDDLGLIIIIRVALFGTLNVDDDWAGGVWAGWAWGSEAELSWWCC